MLTRTKPPVIHWNPDNAARNSSNAREVGATAGTSPTQWHQRSVEEVFEKLDTSEAGLNPGEAQARLSVHGPNRLEAAKRRGVISRFLAQFSNVLLYILIGAAVVTAGGWDSGIAFFDELIDEVPPSCRISANDLD